MALSVFVLSEETTFEAGVKVQIHSQSEPPFIQELGFGVAPGFQTFVATQEQRVSFWAPWTSGPGPTPATCRGMRRRNGTPTSGRLGVHSRGLSRAGLGTGAHVEIGERYQLDSVTQLPRTTCRFLKLGVRETQLTFFFIELGEGFFQNLLGGVEISSGGGETLEAKGTCMTRAMCFITHVDTTLNGLQKGKEMGVSFL